MAAPTVRAWGTEASGTTSASPGLPAGTAENDILVIVCETDASATPSATGYTHVTNSPQTVNVGGSANDTRLSVLWKRAGASESAPTVDNTGGNHIACQMAAIQDCPTTGDPWDVIAVSTLTTGSTSVSWPDLTTTVADTLIMHFGSAPTDTSTDQFSSPANSNLTSVTEEADVFIVAGNGGGFYVVSGVKASAGAIGNTTGTLATSATQALIVVAFKPAAVSNDRLARATWAEMEVPDAPRLARVTWAELETGDAPRLARITWTEMEIPTAPRLARVTWAEMEVSDAPRLARVTWAELEAPATTRLARVTWAELETPDGPRLARITWVELETPDGPRAARITWVEMEAPDVGAAALLFTLPTMGVGH